MELSKKFAKSLADVEAEIGGEGSLPKDWISTGNYCLNKLFSGELERGIPVGRITTFAGPSGVGKSLIMASIIREAAKKGFFTVIFDSESAMDKNFLSALGVDVSKTAYLQVDTIEQFKNKAVEILQAIDDEKVLLVLDSYGNLSTEKELADALAGKNASDMGLKAKAGRATFRVLANMINKKNAALILSNHTYTNASGYVPTEEMSAGKGIEYNSSIVAFLARKKIKDGTEVEGLAITATTQKNRFTPPFKKATFELSFEEGLSQYSGLLEVLCEANVIDNSSQGWYKFGEGEEQIKFRKKEFPEIVEARWDEFKEFDIPITFAQLKLDDGEVV